MDRKRGSRTEVLVELRHLLFIVSLESPSTIAILRIMNVRALMERPIYLTTLAAHGVVWLVLLFAFFRQNCLRSHIRDLGSELVIKFFFSLVTGLQCHILR